jgi:hypothetical protein
MTSGNDHGGRRSGTGRPRRGGGHRNNLLGTSSASLARKYAEEAVRTVVAIMRDEHRSASARVNAARKLLYWGYGPPSNHPIKSSKKDNEAGRQSRRLEPPHNRFEKWGVDAKGRRAFLPMPCDLECHGAAEVSAALFITPTLISVPT